MPIISTLFIGGTNNLKGDLGGFFSLDANMMFNTKDGYYYHVGSITYTRRSEGLYTYMQAASIFEPHEEEDHVSTPNTNAIVKQALEYISTLDPFAFYG